MDEMRAVQQSSTPAVDRLARSQRDASLLRISSLTRAIGAAVVVAVGVVGIYVSRAFPGHSTTAPGTATASSSPGSAGSSAAGGGGAAAIGGGGTVPGSSSAGLSAPSSAPAASPAPPPVVSGAS